MTCGMIRRRKLLGQMSGIMAASFAMAAGGCSSSPRILRYRFVVEMETPEGLKSGMTVVEAKTVFFDSLLGDRSGATYIYGDAPLIDLGERGVVVPTLAKDPIRIKSHTPLGAFEELHKDLRDPNGDTPRSLDRLAQVQGVTEIPLEMLPMLVWFPDRNNPESVRRLEPLNVEAQLGASYRLKRATVEVTKDVPQETIAKALQWLAGRKSAEWIVANKEKYLKDVPIERTLAVGAFRSRG